MGKKTILAAVAAGAAGTALGAVIGATAGSHSREITSLNREVISLRADQGRLQLQASGAEQQAAEARQQMSQAQAQARAQYASKMAQVNALLRKLKSEQQVVVSSTISSDGVYVVGRDIPSGTYHTSGNGQPGSMGCYYALLNSTSTSDIADNNNFDGPETVDLTGVYAFQISGGCTWVKIG